MDAANYALALKKADDPNIKETQLTNDGEENFGYARRISGTEMQQQQQQQDDQAARRGDARSATKPAAFRRSPFTGPRTRSGSPWSAAMSERSATCG